MSHGPVGERKSVAIAEYANTAQANTNKHTHVCVSQPYTDQPYADGDASTTMQPMTETAQAREHGACVATAMHALYAILVTLDVSQDDRSPLKDDA